MKECLIVDDSRVMRRVARRILESLDLAAEEAEDGASALAACRRSMPDAILLDWNMPNGASLEFLRALRREPKGDKPLVIFCTIENDVAHIGEAIGAGANEYVMKPFDKDVLGAKFAETGLLG